MKTAYDNSEKTLKTSSTIFKVLGWLSLVVGIISIAVGGFIFIIFGVIFLSISKYYSNIAKLKGKSKGSDTSNYLMEYEVYINRNSKVYHASKTCHHLKPGFATLKEGYAIRKGYEICKHCKY